MKALTILLALATIGCSVPSTTTEENAPPHRSGVECSVDNAKFLTLDIAASVLPTTELPSVDSFTVVSTTPGEFSVTGPVQTDKGSQVVGLIWTCADGNWNFGPMTVDGSPFDLDAKRELVKVGKR